LVQLRKPRRPAAWMNDDSVSEAHVLSWFDRQTAVLCLVVEEIAHAERIDRVQAVPPRMPIRRVSRIIGMIHHHHANSFAIEFAQVIDPLRPLAPDIRFPLATLSIGRLTGACRTRSRPFERRLL